VIINLKSDINISVLAPNHGSETAGIDMEQRNYVTVTIMYSDMLNPAENTPTTE